MPSRYDFMRNGTVQDEVSGSLYPDPLSLDYPSLSMSSQPIGVEMTPDNIPMIWREAETIYGRACWDDMALTLNGVPHRNMLRPGDVLYFPTEDDLLKSFNKER